MARAKEFPLEPAWRVLLKDLGVRPVDVLRRARLPEALITREDVRLDTDEYFPFWRALEAEIDDPRFPIRIVDALGSGITFVPVLFAAMCSPDLAHAVERIQLYKRLLAPMRLDVRRDARRLEVELVWLDATVDPPASLVIAELAFLLRLAQAATRERIRALAVTAPIPPAPADVFTEWFGAPVKRAAKSSMTFSALDAERPFLTASDQLWKTFEPELRRRLGELDADAGLTERVRAVLFESLPSGRTSMEEVAGQLAVSKRTLQRRLSEEGTSYQLLLARTREDLARHYLSSTSLSCTEISFLLGYDEPSSFFRAFQSWTGETPEGLRQALS